MLRVSYLGENRQVSNSKVEVAFIQRIVQWQICLLCWHTIMQTQTNMYSDHYS